MKRTTTKRKPVKRKSHFHFQVSVEVNHDEGTIEAVYFRVRKGKSVQVVEQIDGIVFADYDKDGHLLGVELLAPCTVAVLDKIAQNEPFSVRNRVKSFFRESVPRKMVA